MDLEQLEKDYAAEGVDPATGEVDESLETNQGEDDVTSETDRVEEEAELGETDTGEPDGQEPEGSGDDQQADGELTEQELELLDKAQEGKGMVEVPVALLNKIKGQKKAALDERDEARRQVEENRNAALQTQVDTQSQIINQMAQGQPAAEQEAPEPDKTLDYEEWAEWRMKKQDAQIEKLSNAVGQNSQATQLQAAQNSIAQMEGVYESVKPGFKDKKEQYLKAYAANMIITHPTASIEQRQAWAKEDFAVMATQMPQGSNVMQTFDNMFDEMGLGVAAAPVAAKPDLEASAKNAKQNKTISNKGTKTSLDARQTLPTHDEYMALNNVQQKAWRKKNKISDKVWKAHTLALVNQAAKDESTTSRHVLLG